MYFIYMTRSVLASYRKTLCQADDVQNDVISLNCVKSYDSNVLFYRTPQPSTKGVLNSGHIADMAGVV